MKGNLAAKFETVRKAIMHEPMLSHAMHDGRQLLVGIMRAANTAHNDMHPESKLEDIRHFNPDTLKAQEIDPKVFMAAMARIFTQETLGYYDNHPPYDTVVVNRCIKALDTSHEYAHGNFLSEEIKDAVRKKLEKNGFARAYAPSQTPY